SSRRRHTRWPRDWSSDVCSSDLYIGIASNETLTRRWDVRPDRMSQGLVRRDPDIVADEGFSVAENNRVRIERRIRDPNVRGEGRSEERRVGKECIWRR